MGLVIFAFNKYCDPIKDGEIISKDQVATLKIPVRAYTAKYEGLNSRATEGYTYHVYPLRNLTHKWMLRYQLSGLRSQLFGPECYNVR